MSSNRSASSGRDSSDGRAGRDAEEEKRAETLPWLRREDESEVAFAAFAAYRDLGYERRIADVALQLSKSEALMYRWAAAHAWRKRALAYDRDTDKKAVREMQRRHARAMQSSQMALAHPLNVLVETLRQRPTLLQELSDEVLQKVARGQGMAAYERLMKLIVDTSRTLPTVQQQERLALGLSSQNVAVAVNGEADGFGYGGAAGGSADGDDAHAGERGAAGAAGIGGGAGDGLDAVTAALARALISRVGGGA